MWRALLGLFVVGCVESAAVPCGDGVLCPEGYTCLPDGGCASADQLIACEGMTDGVSCTASPTGTGYCTAGVCRDSRCGDGYRAPEEICDTTEFATISNCNQVGFYEAKALGCTETCELDESVCAGRCGDNLINGDELCDGTMPPSETCIDFGYGTGALACSGSCGADLSGCVSFEWQSSDIGPVVSVHGTSDTNVWGVGESGVHRYDGDEWLPIDVTACPSDDLIRVFAISDTDAIALTRDVRVLHITAAGCTLTTPSATATALSSIWAFSPTNVYVTSDEGVHHYDGAWTLATPGNAAFIWASGPTDIYVTTANDNTLKHFSNGTWGTVTVPGMDFTVQVFGTGPDDFYVSGVASPFQAALAHKTSTGWSDALDAPFVPTLSLAGPGGVANGMTYVMVSDIEDGTQTYIYGFDGTGWFNTQAPVLETTTDLWVSPTGAIFVGGLAGPYVSGDTLRLRGTTFEPVMTKVVAVSSGEAYALNTKRDVYGWDGFFWNLELSGVDDIAVTADGVVLAVGGSLPVRRRTGSGTWTEIAPGVVGGLVGRHLSALSLTDVWVLDSSVVKHYTGTSTPTTYNLGFSANNVIAVTPTLAFMFGAQQIARWTGGTPVATQAPLDANLYEAWAAGPDHVIASGPSYVLRYDGTTWSVLHEGTGMPEPYVRDAIGTVDDLLVVGVSGIHHYDGQTWQKVATDAQLGVQDIDSVGKSLFYVTQNSAQQLVRTKPW